MERGVIAKTIDAGAVSVEIKCTGCGLSISGTAQYLVTVVNLHFLFGYFSRNRAGITNATRETIQKTITINNTIIQ